MTNRALTVCGAAVLLFACSGGGGGTVEYKNDLGFKATVPSGFTAKPVVTEPGGFQSVSLRNDADAEVFFSWNTQRPAADGLSSFERHRQKPDLTKIEDEGEIPGGKFIRTLRGKMTFVHSVIDCGGIAIECTVSNPINDAHGNACKTLTCTK